MRAGWQALTDEERQLLLSLPVKEAARRFGVGTATVVRWRRAILAHVRALARAV